MKTPQLPDGVQPHKFEDCPECDSTGALEYQTRCDVLCVRCRALFDHEITQSRHRLWKFTHENGLENVAATYSHTKC